MNLSPPAREFPLPARIGRYELLAKIAEGGMASVYLGRLPGPMGFERPVAVKLMRPEFVQNADFVHMFLDEARLVARLSHPSVVQMLELGEDQGPIGQTHGGFYLVMECLMGESLLDVWYACQDRQIMLPYDVIAHIGARAAEGLHHAHELRDAKGQYQNIVHRDVTPGNVFITYEGQVKVIDFGVAKALNRLSAQTGYGVLKGKVAYMSPEQAKSGQVDRRSDVFSLAVTLWELTTDRRLFKRKTDVDTIIAVSEGNVPDPTVIPEYPPALWAVLRKALARDPAQRYATAAEFARDLEAFAQSMGRTVSAATLGEIMTYLFAAQKDRYQRWMQQASEGHAHGLFRTPESRREAMNMAGVDALPLSKRAGHEMSISAVGPPPASPPTISANLVSWGSGARAPSQPPPGFGPAPAYAPGPAPAYATANAPAPAYANAPANAYAPAPAYTPPPASPQDAVTTPPAKEESSKASQIVFFLIAITAIIGLVGFVAWSRMRPAPPPPPGSASAAATSAPAPSTAAPLEPTPPPSATATASAPDLSAAQDADAAPLPSASPSETATAAPPPTTTASARPKPSASPDDILKHRR